MSFNHSWRLCRPDAAAVNSEVTSGAAVGLRCDCGESIACRRSGAMLSLDISAMRSFGKSTKDCGK